MITDEMTTGNTEDNEISAVCAVIKLSSASRDRLISHMVKYAAHGTCSSRTLRICSACVRSTHETVRCSNRNAARGAGEATSGSDVLTAVYLVYFLCEGRLAQELQDPPIPVNIVRVLTTASAHQCVEGPTRPHQRSQYNGGLDV